MVRSSDELNSIIENENKLLNINPSQELKEAIENLEDNKESINILFNIINNQKNLNSFESIFKNKGIGIQTYILNKFREFKSDIKKVFKLRRKNPSFIDLLHKDKIGDNLHISHFLTEYKKLIKLSKLKI